MTKDITSTSGEELTQFVERIERLEEEKQATSNDIGEVYAVVKARGYDVRAIRQIVKMRKLDRDERKEMEAIIELYMAALNMT